MKNNTTIRILLALVLTAALAGCRHQSTPSYVIDTATLAAFLTEAHIIDSYSNIVAATNRDSLQPLVDAAYDSLYAKYNITQQQYDSSIVYYMHHPQLLDSVYKKVIVNLRNHKDRQEQKRQPSNINR